MEETAWNNDATSSSSPEMELLKKKMMEKMSFDMPMPMPNAMTTTTTTNFPSSLLNGSSLSGMMSKDGFSMTTREIKAVKMEQAQVQFSSSSSRSSSQQTSGSLISGQIGSSVVGGTPTSSSWMTSMNLGGVQAMEKKMASSSTISSNSSCASTTASATLGMGVTRSFSSSSGFPPTSMSSGSIHSDGVDSGLSSSNALVSSNFPSFGGSASFSPLKRPFGFRNFDRPLWIDMPFGAKDNQANIRNTWDPAMMLSMKNSGSQVQFSASQHTFFEASNGSFR